MSVVCSDYTGTKFILNCKVTLTPHRVILDLLDFNWLAGLV